MFDFMCTRSSNFISNVTCYVVLYKNGIKLEIEHIVPCTHIISLRWRVLYSTKYFNRKYELMCINCLNVPVFFEGKTLAAQNRFCIFIYLVTSNQAIFRSLSQPVSIHFHPYFHRTQFEGRIALKLNASIHLSSLWNI